MNGKVLDVAQANRAVGTKVVMWTKHEGNLAHQLWYEDKNGAIFSKLNELTLNTSSKFICTSTSDAAFSENCCLARKGNFRAIGYCGIL